MAIRVNFTPEPLLNCQKMYWMKRLRAIEQVQDRPFIPFAWNWTGTLFTPIKGAINGFTTDTSKAYIDEVFTQIYGYSSAATERYAVEKPNYTNGSKDCRLVDLDRYERDQYCFYQKLLIHNEHSIEYRYTVMGSHVVHCLVKNKTVSRDNLIGQVSSYKFAPITDRTKLDAFCRSYPLEYGEIDMIWYDGRPYIIDVNPTPSDADFVNMPKAQANEFIKDYADLLKEWLWHRV